MTDKANIIARITQLSNRPNTHCHKHHHIIFGLSGHAEFEISGMGGYVQKGVGCIVPSDHHHRFFGDSENKVLLLDITNNLALLELETSFKNNALDSILTSPKYFQFDQDMHALLESLASELQAMSKSNAAPSIIGQCLLHSLHYRLCSQISVEEVAYKGNRIDLSRIKRYIYGNLSSKIHTFKGSSGRFKRVGPTQLIE